LERRTPRTVRDYPRASIDRPRHRPLALRTSVKEVDRCGRSSPGRSMPVPIYRSRLTAWTAFTRTDPDGSHQPGGVQLISALIGRRLGAGRAGIPEPLGGTDGRQGCARSSRRSDRCIAPTARSILIAWPPQVPGAGVEQPVTRIRCPAPERSSARARQSSDRSPRAACPRNWHQAPPSPICWLRPETMLATVFRASAVR
jgi:hypothetical protein